MHNKINFVFEIEWLILEVFPSLVYVLDLNFVLNKAVKKECALVWQFSDLKLHSSERKRKKRNIDFYFKLGKINNFIVSFKYEFFICDTSVLTLFSPGWSWARNPLAEVEWNTELSFRNYGIYKTKKTVKIALFEYRCENIKDIGKMLISDYHWSQKVYLMIVSFLVAFVINFMSISTTFYKKNYF